MASIRKLKKDINYLAYDLLTEAFTYKHFHPDLEEKKLDDVIREIVKLRNELIFRLNHPNGDENISKSEHYRKIENDMVKMVQLMEALNK